MSIKKKNSAITLITSSVNNSAIFDCCRGMVHRSDVSEGWSVPFMSADRALTTRTQRFLYDKYKERPAQIQFYTTFKCVYYR